MSDSCHELEPSERGAFGKLRLPNQEDALCLLSILQKTDVGHNGQIGLDELQQARKTHLSKAEEAAVDRFGMAIAEGKVGHVVGTRNVPMLAGPATNPDYWERKVNVYAITTPEIEQLSKK